MNFELWLEFKARPFLCSPLPLAEYAFYDGQIMLMRLERRKRDIRNMMDKALFEALEETGL